MSVLEALAIVGVGLVAGTVNTIVGSGSLITFPTLLAFGFSPIVANVSNTVGLAPGSLSGAIAYRRELHGQRPRLLVLGTASVTGAITGAVLLLALPGSVFRHVVPALILVACVLVALQPRLSARLALRADRPVHGGPVLFATVFFTGVYGGYFGAAQGVILAGVARDLPHRPPATTQRHQERARSRRQRRGRASSSSWSSPTCRGRPPVSWRPVRSSVARWAAPSDAGCRPRCCVA